MAKQICVFCGASQHVDPKFLNAAYEIGKKITEAGYELVWGAGSYGSMGMVAEGCVENGGHATGFIPDFLRDREPTIVNPKITNLYVEDMADRKKMFEANSDAFIILPGGVGTMDEFFQVCCLKHLGVLNKPIILFNQNGFYDELIKWMIKMEDEKFASGLLEKILITDDLEEVLKNV